ncbi:MAG: SDR family NAD(P)-dependent oxidoreductase [Anaerolineae bacterium]|nr:SDR family NAD(P)-dependent oxidoreductase [Anaerolineae bacterium]
MIPVSELISLRGRRALVTGAASGIGEAIARRLAEAGAALLLVDIQEEALHRLADRLRAAGGEAHPVRLDLGDEEAVRALWKRLPDAQVPDILVNNAGIYPFRDFSEVDPGFLEHVLRVNLKAALWMCQGMIARRDRRSGAIIRVELASEFPAEWSFKPISGHLKAALRIGAQTFRIQQVGFVEVKLGERPQGSQHRDDYPHRFQPPCWDPIPHWSAPSKRYPIPFTSSPLSTSPPIRRPTLSVYRFEHPGKLMIRGFSRGISSNPWKLTGLFPMPAAVSWSPQSC